MNKIFEELQEEIVNSQYILAYEDNWDGNGATRYTYEVWERATTFVKNLFEYYYETYGNIPEIPHIYHGPNNSIDIFWNNKEVFDLLINVPETGLVSFAFQMYSTENSSKGMIDISHKEYRSLPNILF